ncbi:PKD domain-containing protein, partial [Lentimicrobium sp. S6]|uniref:PKD domain-containing protein n=1 Tax=Lentimicrobium sp. S6 TaxID=2735872 RepID=UPI0015560EC6
DPQYIFPAVDLNYPVSLIATDERGCVDTTETEIFIPSELTVSFLADTVCYGEATMLVAHATKPENAEVKYWTWYFDDGSPQLSTTRDTVYHVFTSDGEFRVELQGQEPGGCVNEVRKNVMVRELPTADFLAEAAACADTTFFIDQSSTVLEDGIQQWRWYFGNGETETINAPSDGNTEFLYPPYLETFNVSLAVSDEFGCVDSISHGVQRYPCIFVNFVTDTSIY